MVKIEAKKKLIDDAAYQRKLQNAKRISSTKLIAESENYKKRFHVILNKYPMVI